MLPRLFFAVLLAAVAPISVLAADASGDERLAQILPRAERVLIASVQESVDLREAGQITMVMDRALRGRGRKGESIRVAHDGSPGTVEFSEGQQYLVLLQPSLDGDSVWTYVGASAFPFREGKVDFPTTGDEGSDATVEFTDLQGAVDRHPSSADAMIPLRTSLNGRWVAETALQGKTYPLWILEVREQDGTATAEVLAFAPQFRSATVESISIDDEGKVNYQVTTELVEDGSRREYGFEGQLRDGVVKGNLGVEQNNIHASKLRATGAKTILQAGGIRPVEGNETFEKAVIAEDEYAAYQEFAKQFARSPLAMDAYIKILKSEVAAELPEEEVGDFADRFVANAAQWGETMRRQATVDAGVAIAEKKQHPQLALKYLTEAESFLSETVPPSWRMLVPFHLAMMLRQTGKVEEASQRLKAYHELHPYEPIGAFYAATALEEAGEFKEAARIYAKICVLPKTKEILERTVHGNDDKPVDEKMMTLWREHLATVGDRNEFVEFMIGSYRDAIHPFEPENVETPAVEAGKQRREVLVEFYTNAHAPTCVAPDLALSALAHEYGPSQLVSLRYYVSTEDPDAFAAPEGAERMHYYGSNTLPTTCLNGTPHVIGGEIFHTEKVYYDLQELVKPLLGQTVDIELSLTATRASDKLKISVTAQRPGGFKDSHRLRMALVESEAPLETQSELKLHENVVRIMPGGAQGVSPQEGKLSFEMEMSIDDYRKQLNETMTKIEEHHSNMTGKEFTFPIRPIGPGKLKLAAFVQDDATKQVLQAAITDFQDLSETTPQEKAADEREAAEKN